MTETKPALAPADELREAVDSAVEIIVLVRGTLADGRAFWAYASMPPSRYPAYKAMETAGQSYRLEDWGTILRHGLGEEPPLDVKVEMHDAYGADDQFETNMLRLADQG